MAWSARSLLREIDPLPYPARQRLLARIARDGRDTAELDHLLNELSNGDPFSRRIALQVASIAGHRDCIVRSLDVGDVALAARAITVAVRLRIADAAIAALVPDLAPELRQVLYRACRRHRVTELAERILPDVRGRWGGREAAALLATCQSGTVARLLPELEYAVTSWAGLTRRHPEVVLDFFETQLAALPSAAWGELWVRLGPGIATQVVAEPGRVLTLIERSSSRVGLPASLVRHLAGLARYDRDRTLRVVLDPRRPGAAPEGRTFWRAFADASDVDLVKLARSLAPRQLQPFLHSLPPSRRSAIYRELLGGRDLVGSGLPVSILDELPEEARIAEAARVLRVPSTADDPHIRLEVTARLVWSEARVALGEATRRPTAEERAEAYPLYIGAARLTRDPEVVGATLASLTRLANEQDPVRAAAMSALAALPTWMFREVDADHLRTLMINAVQARDSSPRTKSAVAGLCRGLIREGAVSRRPPLVAAGLDGLQLLSEHLAYVGLHGLDRSLPRGTERSVFDALKPRLDADARIGRFSMALALAAGLRRRAWPLAELQTLVEKALSAKDDGLVRQAVSLWLAPSTTRDARVQQILRTDRSMITIPTVQAALASRRTDLLDDIFRRPLHGRFIKRGVRYVPTFQGCFDAWLPRQTTAYADLLLNLATAPGASIHQRVSAVHTLGRVPGTADYVRLFVFDADVSVQEAALAALAWTDDPTEVISDLVAHANGDRARVATYALTRCARFVPAGRLRGFLQPLLSAPKVTSRKEAIRLLAQHRAVDVSLTLDEMWAEPGQHRDVKRAIVSAVRHLLDAESSWDLLEQASADSATATAIVEAPPASLPVSQRARFTELICTVAKSADVDNARAALQVLPRWAPWAGRGGLDTAAAWVTNLDTTSVWRLALDSLIVSCDLMEDDRALVAVTTALLETLDDQFPDRDQPALQRLIELANRLRSRVESSDALRGVASRVADHMAQVAPDAALELASAAIPWDDVGAAVAALSHLAELAPRPTLLRIAQRGVNKSLSRVVTRLDPADAQRIARSQVDAATPATAALGLGIVQAAGMWAGWSEPWKSLLAELRVSDDRDVRDAALATFTAPE